MSLLVRVSIGVNTLCSFAKLFGFGNLGLEIVVC